MYFFFRFFQVSLTFDQPKISPDRHEPVEQQHNLTVIIGAAASGKQATQ